MRAVRFALLFSFGVSVCCAQLAIVDPKFHEYESGPLVASSSVFRAGDTIFLSFRVSGFQTTGEDEDQFKISYQIRTTDSADRLIAEPRDGKLDASLAPEDKKRKWMPRFHYEVQIPQAAAAGNYLIHITVRDEVSQKSETKDVPFAVGGRAVESAESLVVRGFQLMRSEKEGDELPESGSYRPGDTLFARFEIAGYRYGPGNRLSVAYGVSMLDDTGKALYTEPKAAEETDQSFYPKQYVPAILSLKLDPRLKPGSYVLSIHVVDKVGSQEIDSAHPFRVER